MKIEDKYKNAKNYIDGISGNQLSENKYPALGYTSNLDILCDFQIEIFNGLIAEYLQEAVLEEMKPAKMICTMEDFVQSVIFFCSRGIGGEIDIDNIKIIDNIFDTQYGMGGTAAQGAMALSSIGYSSIIHLTDDSKEVCEILQSPYIYTINSKKEMIHTKDVIQCREQEVHYIIQFKKGDIIRLKNQKIIIPSSNRLILTKNTVNETVPFSKPYFQYIESNAKKISSNVLSSFNVIQDKAILLERLDYVKQHITKYKTFNERGIVYFEDAHYHSREIRNICFENIYSLVDIVSLNEEELAYALETDGVDFDINNIILCVEGLKHLRQKYKIQKGVIVHTKDYSMYVGNKLEVDIESGLIYGNLLATAKAMFGCYGTKEQINDILKLPLSKNGMKNKEIIEDESFVDEVVIVPTKYIDKPKYTIGLGDSFVAGVQICFN